MMNAQSMTVVMAAAVAVMGGCISVKTESEVKPIHITMDINLKVDKEIDKTFEGESMSKPKGDFTKVKALLDRKVAGINRLSLLEARKGATDDEKIAIAEFNALKKKRLQGIAAESGVALEAVQKRSAARLREKLPEGCGVWVESDGGVWSQR